MATGMSVDRMDLTGWEPTVKAIIQVIANTATDPTRRLVHMCPASIFKVYPIRIQKLL